MAGKRRRCSAEFKAKVALEALKGDLTVVELAAKHGVHQTRIPPWKRPAVEGMSGGVSGKAEAAAADREAELSKLKATIGEWVVERDFCGRASGCAPSVRARPRADDERVPEARDDRSRSPAVVDRPAVQARGDQPVGASQDRRRARAR